MFVFEDVYLFKSPPCLSSLTLCVFGVLGEFGWWSYCRGLVGYVVFAEGGVICLEMEEMFLRRLVVILWKKICSSCLNQFGSGLVVCVFFVGVSCLEGFCAV